ncbi:MFS multidrug transporter [Aaosphaeria arxii CBS 175.79]|uniref:MFS multidrug transporter n=1 Tax=Aaosphaeria arxii CBS 175.79 TaxID=1450172 RepID=A0A6A5Y8U6_9PLEO|nr:MFS multidrug transporter [Aaosphaeria arxii CBS 175.79]KAF2022022.1 MFS multidrug transporter [Aaosphaeria arxii CBS 175.79]
MEDPRIRASSGSTLQAKSEGAQDAVSVAAVGSNEPLVVDGKVVLREEDAFDKTAYAWSPRRKWIMLTIVAICQTSMNFNAAIYSNAVEGINKEFGVHNARHGMVAFLVAYAFGCELWAPWSEELGRYGIMQTSLILVNASILICARSTSFPMMIGGRVLGGLSSAGGSVTLGMVADMFSTDDQQPAVLWASLWSCLGAVIGGICGGPLEQYAPWRWIFYAQLVFGLITQVLHASIARESRSTLLLDRDARRQRKLGVDVWGPNEVRTVRERWDPRRIFTTMYRPYHMLATEPIVFLLSLLSGFADMLIFMFFESYGYVFERWGFTPTQRSYALIALALSYVLSYLSFFPVIKRHNARRRSGETLAPETRLWWLLFQCVLLPIGLLGGAFAAAGPPLHWSGFIVFSCCIGAANFAIYYATVDYMVAAYGEYSASATGGNGFARDFLAGLCAIYTGPMYRALGVRNSMLVLFGFGFLFCIPVFVFYLRGPAIRKRSKFAQKIARDREDRDLNMAAAANATS